MMAGYSALLRPLTVFAKPVNTGGVLNIAISWRPFRQLNTVNEVEESENAKSISRVMNHYLRSIQSKKKLIEDETAEFEIGRRHLARIMGEDIEYMDQGKIDRAIRYLFPSGLFDQRARPMMKPPSEIYYSIKEAQFNMDGRPFNFQFFTGKQNFYTIMFELGNCLESADIYRYSPDQENLKVMQQFESEMARTRNMSKEELQNQCLESISDLEYQRFCATVDRLSDHPNAWLFQDSILKCRKEISTTFVAPKFEAPCMDENGRLYQTSKGKRRQSTALVTVKMQGTGQIKITHPNFPTTYDILYFTRLKHREMILIPLIISGTLGQVDIDIELDGEVGFTNHAFAIRYAISWALASLVGEEKAEQLRLAGLLTEEIMLPERKMYGRAGPRKRFKWRKR